MSESDEGYPWKRSFFLPATQQQFPLGRAGMNVLLENRINRAFRRFGKPYFIRVYLPVVLSFFVPPHFRQE
ncbi:Uncharacterised protein [Sphingobacterium thalpophilum]|uniref:Uncharacterized protein n=1 Tax=Sphingobacterium thalpophilum TaxID=259 RepID=A0A4U9ULD8_9SPHI|nr:Uncharacterised protein [Sphingobacterium thalpophilum]